MGVSSDRLKLTAYCAEFPIRKATYDVKTSISLVLVDVASAYGVREKLDDRVMREAIKFVMSKFKDLHEAEIKEAYRCYYAGEFEGVRGAEPYGGISSVATLGTILSAYRKQRNKLKASIQVAAAEIGAEIREKKEHQHKQARFEREFAAAIAKAQTNQIEWHDIPAFWYEVLSKKGRITFEPGEALLIYKQAQAQAQHQWADMKEARTQFASIVRNQGAPAARDYKDNQITKTAKTIARKMTVHIKIIKPCQHQHQ